MNALEAERPLLEDSAARTGDAAILAISSVSAVMSQRAEAYGAMKAALEHYISGLATFVTGSNMVVDGGIKPCVSF